MKLINIGFGNMVSAARMIAIVSPESAPIKRIIQDAKEKATLIDATYGRRTRAVIITDSEHVILSAVQPETVAARAEPDTDMEEDEEDEPEPDDEDEPEEDEPEEDEPDEPAEADEPDGDPADAMPFPP